jgi:hypothetical protein
VTVTIPVNETGPVFGRIASSVGGINELDRLYCYQYADYVYATLVGYQRCINVVYHLCLYFHTTVIIKINPVGYTPLSSIVHTLTGLQVDVPAQWNRHI